MLTPVVGSIAVDKVEGSEVHLTLAGKRVVLEYRDYGTTVLLHIPEDCGAALGGKLGSASYQALKAALFNKFPGKRIETRTETPRAYRIAAANRAKDESAAPARKRKTVGAK